MHDSDADYEAALAKNCVSTLTSTWALKANLGSAVLIWKSAQDPGHSAMRSESAAFSGHSTIGDEIVTVLLDVLAPAPVGVVRLRCTHPS